MNVARIAEKICNQLMHVMIWPPPPTPPTPTPKQYNSHFLMYEKVTMVTSLRSVSGSLLLSLCFQYSFSLKKKSTSSQQQKYKENINEQCKNNSL